MRTVRPPKTHANPVDAFIPRKLAEEGLDSAPPADRYQLLRRLSFDLTGLPPSPEEIEAFLQDDSEEATGRVIDRLLTIDAAPLNATRTALKLFEIPEIQCPMISEILVHDIGSCKPQNADEADCFPLIDLISRTDAKLVF